MHKTTGVMRACFGKQNIRQALRSIGVWKDKHIPEIYLQSSFDQKLDLLAGLIDTDGHVERDTSRVRIATVSVKLKNSLLELLLWLGQKPWVYEQQPCVSTSGIEGHQVVYYVGFQPTIDIPTKIPRKQIERIVPDRRLVSIVSVKFEPNGEQGKCIQVDSPDGLYLVGRTLIPTHNSQLLSEYFPAWFLGRNPDKSIIATSYGQELASDFGRKVRNQIIDPSYKSVFNVGIAEDSAAVDKFNLSAPNRGGYFAVGVGGAITGRGANCFVAGTQVLTDQGNIFIDDLICTPERVKILSYNFKESRIEYQKIEAISSRKGFGIYRVTTSNGRMVETTGDHPILYKEKGISQRVHLPPVIISCTLCHKEIIRPSFQIQKSIRNGHPDHYCSKECSQTHHATKNSPRCLGCGNVLENRHHKQRTYCFGCKPKQKPPGRAVIYPPVKTICPTCNTEFMAVWRGISTGKYAQYCGRRCSDIGHSIRMIGTGNPHWLNGKNPLRQQPHSAKSYRTMRPFVLKRDDTTCVSCGVSGIRLHVHHLDGNATNNIASNLVTLCPKCHSQIHAAMDYGKDMTKWSPLLEYAKRPLFMTYKWQRIITCSQMEFCVTTA